MSYETVIATIFWVEVEKPQHEQPAPWKQWMVLMARCGVGNPQVRLDRLCL